MDPTTTSTLIKVEPWPTEKMIQALVMVFSGLVWFALTITIFGLIYVALFGFIFFIGHVIFISHIRGSAVKLGPDQMPDLYETIDRLAKRMGFEQTPDAYLMQAGGVLNALATKLFKSNMIVLYSDLMAACGDNKVAREMIIAHELGHIKEGHLKWHWFILPGLMVPFLGSALSRAREYTCDRYGLAYAGDRAGALRGLTILAAGAERGPQVNLQSMARQVEDMNTGFMTLGSWLGSHPPLAHRVIALEESLKPQGFSDSRGTFRALGIIGALYVGPLIIVIILIALAAATAPKNRPKPLYEEPTAATGASPETPTDQ